MAAKTFSVIIIDTNGTVNDTLATPSGRNPAEIIAALRPNHQNDMIVVMNDGNYVMDWPATSAPPDAVKQAALQRCEGWASVVPGLGNKIADGGWTNNRAIVALPTNHRTNAQSRTDAIAFAKGWLDNVAGPGPNGGSGNGNGGNNGGSGNGNGGGNNGGSGNNGGGSSNNGGNGGGNNGGSGNNGNSGGMDPEYEAGLRIYRQVHRITA